MFYVYILLSNKDGKTYVGYTKNLVNRLRKHNLGELVSTKNRRPLKLLLSEDFPTIKEAKDRELWWKSSTGRKEMKRRFFLEKDKK